jgi:hypothetical protein
MALDTPCRKWFAHPARDMLRLRRSSSRSWWRVDLYVFSDTLSSIHRVNRGSFGRVDAKGAL